MHKWTFNFTFWILLPTLLACNRASHEGRQKIVSDSVEQNSQDFIKITKDSISAILYLGCNNKNYEFTDLYSEANTIPEIDFLILDDSLKSRGFYVTDYGRGNFMGGPRMISLTLENKKCKCWVEKLYYSNSLKTKKFRVTERLSCKAKTEK